MTSPFELFQQRWHVRTMAHLHRFHGARFVALKHALNVHADPLSRCLEQLQALSLLQKNPGYGHPLRPEYTLTERGARIAPLCNAFESCVARLEAADAVYRKWSVPVLVQLNTRAMGFSELRQTLALTPRALSQGLDRLVRAELVLVETGYKPTAFGAEIAHRAIEVGDAWSSSEKASH